MGEGEGESKTVRRSDNRFKAEETYERMCKYDHMARARPGAWRPTRDREPIKAIKIFSV